MFRPSPGDLVRRRVQNTEGYFHLSEAQRVWAPYPVESSQPNHPKIYLALSLATESWLHALHPLWGSSEKLFFFFFFAQRTSTEQESRSTFSLKDWFIMVSNPGGLVINAPVPQNHKYLELDTYYGGSVFKTPHFIHERKTDVHKSRG